MLPMRGSKQEMPDRMAIAQARFGLGNPRETKAFAIGNHAGKWSITMVQMGNNFAHTLRDKSQVKIGIKYSFISMIIALREIGSFSVKSDLRIALAIHANHIRRKGEEIRRFQPA